MLSSVPPQAWVVGSLLQTIKIVGRPKRIWWVDYKILCCSPVMLVGMQLNHTLELCIYLKKFIFRLRLLFSWQTLEGSSCLDKWISDIFCSAEGLHYFTSGSFVTEMLSCLSATMSKKSGCSNTAIHSEMLLDSNGCHVVFTILH